MGEDKTYIEEIVFLVVLSSGVSEHELETSIDNLSLEFPMRRRYSRGYETPRRSSAFPTTRGMSGSSDDADLITDRQAVRISR